MNDNLGYLFAAYTADRGIGVFVYVRRLARRGRELEEELRRPAPPRSSADATPRASRAVADVVKPCAMRVVVCVK